jgi:hypothetical protein
VDPQADHEDDKDKAPAATAGARPAPDLAARVEALGQALAAERVAREAMAQGAPSSLEGLAAEGVDADEPKLQLYGFLDAGLQRYFLSESTRNQAGSFSTTEATFVTGHTNLYVDARPVPKWRGLVEARLSLFPHGTFVTRAPGPLPVTDNRVTDTSSPSGREAITWGGVVLERSQIEWAHADWLTITVGYFLTPWGIWNVDHGTPTLISLMMPSYLVQGAIPKQQTGVQASGSFDFAPWSLGYRLFVSNGRTATQFDFTDDKAGGVRLFAQRMGATRLQIGASSFEGTSQDQQRTLVFDAAGVPSITVAEKFSVKEGSVGLDFSLDWKGLRLRLEGVERRVRYRDGQHDRVATIPGALVPNRREYYGYVLAAYRLGPVEPYVYLEAGDSGVRSNYLPDKGWARSVGVNVHLSPATQLKIQVADVGYSNLTGPSRLQFVTSRLVLAF